MEGGSRRFPRPGAPTRYPGTSSVTPVAIDRLCLHSREAEVEARQANVLTKDEAHRRQHRSVAGTPGKAESD
jgi:hypothetical protein